MWALSLLLAAPQPVSFRYHDREGFVTRYSVRYEFQARVGRGTDTHVTAQATLSDLTLGRTDDKRGWRHRLTVQNLRVHGLPSPSDTDLIAPVAELEGQTYTRKLNGEVVWSNRTSANETLRSAFGSFPRGPVRAGDAWMGSNEDPDAHFTWDGPGLPVRYAPIDLPSGTSVDVRTWFDAATGVLLRHEVSMDTSVGADSTPTTVRSRWKLARIAPQK